MWSLERTIIAVIIIVAIIAVAIIATRVMGLEIPRWVWQIVGICVAAFVAIIAIRFLLTL